MPVHLLNKKAQLQMGESAIVIILILIIAVFALVFTTRQAQEKYQVKLDTFQEGDAIETAQIITNLYELRCAKTGLRTTCVDVHKAAALAALINNDPAARSYYYDLFFNAKIILTPVYPEGEPITLYEQNATAGGSQITRSIVIPVSIHNATTDQLVFGTLTIERYHRGIA